jgi:GGDEF domain-containing protein
VARTIADRVGAAIAAVTEGTPLHVTESVGVSCWLDDGSSAGEFVVGADRRRNDVKLARSVIR